jgi:hypothetical protein
LTSPSDGILRIKEGSDNVAELIIRDVAGNSSSLKIFIRGEKNISSDYKPDSGVTKIFPFGENNSFKTEKIVVDIPANILYDTLYFRYSSSSPATGRFLSDIHSVHDKFTPVHSHYTLSIKPGRHFNPDSTETATVQ